MSSHHLNCRSFLKAGAAGSAGTGLATNAFAANTTKAGTKLLKVGIIFGGGLVGLDELDEDWAVGPPWGHAGKPSMEEQKAYKGLFGEEKGELRPDKTFG